MASLLKRLELVRSLPAPPTAGVTKRPVLFWRVAYFGQHLKRHSSHLTRGALVQGYQCLHCQLREPKLSPRIYSDGQSASPYGAGSRRDHSEHGDLGRVLWFAGYGALDPVVLRPENKPPVPRSSPNANEGPGYVQILNFTAPIIGAQFPIWCATRFSSAPAPA